MSRASFYVLAAVLLAVLIPSAILCLQTADTEADERSASGRVEPRCVSTAEILADGSSGTELRFSLEWTEDDSEGAPNVRTVAGEPVRASYRPADDVGAPLGKRVWQARSFTPGEYSVLVRVPELGAIEADVLSCKLISHDGVEVAAPDGLDLTRCVTVSAPSIMRDLRLVTVTFDPVLNQPPLDAQVRSVDVSITATAAPGVNEKTSRDLPFSTAFARLYESEVINYDGGLEEELGLDGYVGQAVTEPWDGTLTGGGDADRDPRPTGAKYLIVASDSMATSLEPLIYWKELKGLPVELATLETIGFTFENIRDYIQDAYDTWEMPPEYVLLVGDTEIIPAPRDTIATDNYYVTTEGDDIFPDILVGRFSVDLVCQCDNMVEKTVFYERTPYEDQQAWPASGSLCQRDDDDENNWIYYENTWYLYDLFNDAGFTAVDTLFAKYGLGYEDVMGCWNSGRGFIHYRGQAFFFWVTPFGLPIHHEYGVRNGLRSSIVVSPTCGTGTYDTDGFMCEDWTTGLTGVEPHGAVAFFGTSTAGNSMKLQLTRSSVSFGFFGQAFGESGLTIGEACIAGKLNMYETFADTSEYEGWNLLGDPELNMWTAPPAHITVLHDPAVQVGQEDITVTVLDEGAPVPGALVSCVKVGEVYSYGWTGQLGHVTLPIAPATAGTLFVTVTARNCYPYEGAPLVLESGPFVAFSGYVLEDSSGGNDDGLLSPGESPAFELGLMNVGNVLAENVSAVFRTGDSYVTLTDSTAAFADIDPDSVGWALDDIAFSVDPSCPPGHLIAYSLEVSYGGDTGLRYPAPIEVVTGRLAYAGAVFDDAPPGGDGDGLPEAGETVALELSLLNEGSCDLAEIEGVISADDAFAAVTWGNAPFGDAPTGMTCANAADALLLSISPAAPDGHAVEFALALDGAGHSYAWSDTLTFEIELSNPTYMGPTGPDAYGYYAYDSMDTIYAAAPTYDWVDIAPPGPGNIITEITDEDAEIVTFATMFNVKYYGVTDNQVSINSNGFMTFGPSDYRFGDNSPIPDEYGPENMIAAFWDDLDPSAGGDIYRWFDIVNKRWIYQFDEVVRWGTTQAQTFQIIIMNQTYYPTPTGDSPILFQYETVSFPYSCTVGIENEDQDDGIQWLYDSTYAPQALPIQDGMAILFTTVPPGTPDIPWLVLDATTVDDSAGGNGDGVVQPGETVSLTLGMRNDGGRDALGASVVLLSGESVVTVVDGTSAMPDVIAGGSASTSDALTCTFSETIDDTVATLWAAFEANGGAYTTTARLDLHIDLSDTGVNDDVVPAVFSLSPCHPNPFTQGATMRLALPTPGRVTVKIYDPAGRLVRTLSDKQLPAGEHSFVWDGKDGSGRHVASGVYFVRAEAGRQSGARKVVLLR